MKINKVSILLLTMFIFFLIINYWQPLIVDDLERAYLDAFFHHWLTSAIYGDYHNLTGRISAQIPVYILFSKSHSSMTYLIDIINSVAIVFFIVYFFKSVSKNKLKLDSYEFATYLLILISFAFFSKSFGNIIWKTVAIQYFWGMCLITYFYYRCFTLSRFSPFLSIITGLIIGLYNEAFFALSLVISIIYLFDCKINTRKINKNVFFFLIPLFISGVIILSAPGSYQRAASIDGGMHGIELIKFLATNTYHLIRRANYLTCTFILCILIAFFSNKYIKSRIINITYILIIFSTIIPSSIAATDRVLLPYYLVLGFIILNHLLTHQNKISKSILSFSKKKNKTILSIILLMFITIFVSYYSLHTQIEHRDKNIQKYHTENIKNPEFSSINVNKYVYMNDITKDPKYWNNVTFAKYYDFDTVRIK